MRVQCSFLSVAHTLGCDVVGVLGSRNDYSVRLYTGRDKTHQLGVCLTMPRPKPSYADRPQEGEHSID